MTMNERKQLWSDQIAAQKASGQNITDWCEAHQINRQIHYWIRNLENNPSIGSAPKPKPQWTQVIVKPQPVAVESSMTIRLVDGKHL